MNLLWIVFIIAAEAVPTNVPMTEVTGLLKILQDYGVGGLFFAMYLTTVYAYRKTMMEYADKAEEACPRGLLRRVVKRAADMGFGVKSAAEFEFFVFDETPNSVREKSYRNLKTITPGYFGYSVLRSSVHAEFYHDLMKLGRDIGKIKFARCFWNMGSLWMHPRKPEWTDMEWQLRNWLYFTWLSGDHIVEQHVHNIDVANWVMGGKPVRVFGVGGRQARTGPEYGHIFDHFGLDFEYENGTHALSMCRQQAGTPFPDHDRAHGCPPRRLGVR
jgi:hypothetical protein